MIRPPFPGARPQEHLRVADGQGNPDAPRREWRLRRVRGELSAQLPLGDAVVIFGLPKAWSTK
jgi:hypothetical protein